MARLTDRQWEQGKSQDLVDRKVAAVKEIIAVNAESQELVLTLGSGQSAQTQNGKTGNINGLREHKAQSAQLVRTFGNR